MQHTHLLKVLLLGLLLPSSLIIIIIIICIFFFRFYIRRNPENEKAQIETATDPESGNIGDNGQNQELMCFQGGEDLTISDILEAPGEVIAKSSFGTMYKANLSTNHSILLLRFLRPTCSGTIKEVIHAVHMIGLVRHPNLVPLRAFYMGPRGEKLMIHPFYAHGNLAQFIKDGNECRKWDVIYNISIGLAKGLAHLHTGLHKPIIHGNLKSKNVLLGRDFRLYISDYGLHLLLNPTAGQEMLDASASQGYKPPELMKMRDVCESTDIYSLGIVLLELLTGSEPINVKSSNSGEYYLPSAIRSAILDHRINDMYHPDILANQSGRLRQRTEDRLLKLVQLAMSCCSPSSSLRPDITEVVRKLEEIGN